MELTVKKKAFLENLPAVVEEAVKEYGPRLRKIVIEEDAKGCYTVWITYESERQAF
ncbi:hypothetical protein [Thermococcus camini]|uniref:ABM domain-containing protein n=1 Tax=Thermococcus camini TaxID=2016373 RepID=A0A7G2D4G5_9EURY|nr:hypothetical protein [Thermococcus camini]CAD5243387.1 conserved protein of unknown function [Thermococcus camini]